MELLLGFWLGWGGTGLWGEIVSCHAIPIFHALSIFPLFLVVSAIFSSYSYSNRFQPSVGLVMAVLRPAVPAVLPNPKNVFEGMVMTNCSLGVSVPTYLEVMWTVLRFLLSHSRLYQDMVSQPRFRKLSQDHEGSCMLLCTN
jgi:hypothetical protein